MAGARGEVGFGGSIGCGTTSTSFTVHEVSYGGDGKLAVLAVDFDLQCTGDFQGRWQGALRFHSTVPVGALLGDPSYYDAGEVATDATVTSTRSLQNVGTAPVTVTSLAITGAASSSWSIGNDGCSGTTLAAGASCSYDVAVHPADAGTLAASATVTSDAYVPSLTALTLTAHGRIATTVTVDTSVAQPAVGQEFSVRATVSPGPDHGIVDMWLDDTYLGRYDLVNGATVAQSWIYGGVSLGVVHHARAEFYSMSGNATAASDEYSFTAADTTATTITASSSRIYTDMTVTITAKVTGPTGLAGGTLTIWDYETNAVLKSVNVTGTVRTASLTTKLAAGDRYLIGEYSGAPDFAPSLAGVGVTVLPDTGVAVTPTMPSTQTFYPYKDGYKDLIGIGAKLEEPATVSVAIYRPTGSKLPTISLGTKTTTYKYTWTGRSSSGTMYPTGKYRIVQTLKDRTGHTRSLTSYATISSKRLYTYTTYLNKTVSQAVKKTSSYGIWQFTIPSATVYKALSFQAYGKSTGTPGISIGGQDFRECALVYYDPSCVTSWRGVGYSTAWASKTLSTSYNRSGHYVRGYVVAAGSGVVYKVRLKVSYALLK